MDTSTLVSSEDLLLLLTIELQLLPGRKIIRIVNSVSALKSYTEWKHNGAIGAWKFGGILKPTLSSKSFVRKNSEPFTNSLSRTSSINEKTLATLNFDIESNKMFGSHSLSVLVHSILLDKKPGEIPMLVESVLNKVGGVWASNC